MVFNYILVTNFEIQVLLRIAYVKGPDQIDPFGTACSWSTPLALIHLFVYEILEYTYHIYGEAHTNLYGWKFSGLILNSGF